MGKGEDYEVARSPEPVCCMLLLKKKKVKIKFSSAVDITRIGRFVLLFLYANKY